MSSEQNQSDSDSDVGTVDVSVSSIHVHQADRQKSVSLASENHLMPARQISNPRDSITEISDGELDAPLEEQSTIKSVDHHDEIDHKHQDSPVDAEAKMVPHSKEKKKKKKKRRKARRATMLYGAIDISLGDHSTNYDIHTLGVLAYLIPFSGFVPFQFFPGRFTWFDWVRMPLSWVYSLFVFCVLIWRFFWAFLQPRQFGTVEQVGWGCILAIPVVIFPLGVSALVRLQTAQQAILKLYDQSKKQFQAQANKEMKRRESEARLRAQSAENPSVEVQESLRKVQAEAPSEQATEEQAYQQQKNYVRMILRIHTVALIIMTGLPWWFFNSGRLVDFINGDLPTEFNSSADALVAEKSLRVYVLLILFSDLMAFFVPNMLVIHMSVMYHIQYRRAQVLVKYMQVVSSHENKSQLVQWIQERTAALYDYQSSTIIPIVLPLITAYTGVYVTLFLGNSGQLDSVTVFIVPTLFYLQFSLVWVIYWKFYRYRRVVAERIARITNKSVNEIMKGLPHSGSSKKVLALPAAAEAIPDHYNVAHVAVSPQSNGDEGFANLKGIHDPEDDIVQPRKKSSFIERMSRAFEPAADEQKQGLTTTGTIAALPSSSRTDTALHAEVELGQLSRKSTRFEGIDSRASIATDASHSRMSSYDTDAGPIGEASRRETLVVSQTIPETSETETAPATRAMYSTDGLSYTGSAFLGSKLDGEQIQDADVLGAAPWAMYTTLSFRTILVSALLVAYLVFRMLIGFPDCVSVQEDAAERILDAQDTSCSFNTQVMRNVESAVLGFGAVPLTPAFVGQLLTGVKKSHKPFAFVFMTMLTGSTIGLVLVAKQLEYSITSQQYIAMISYGTSTLFWAVMGGWKLRSSFYAKFFSFVSLAFLVIRGLQGAVIVPEYAKPESEQLVSRILIVLVLHPLLLTCARIMANVMCNIMSRIHGTQNVITILVVPQVMLAIAGRLYLVNIDDIATQVYATILLTVVEIASRLTAPFRVFARVWLFSRGNEAKAYYMSEMFRVSPVYRHSRYLDMLAELLAIITAPLFSVLFKWHADITMPDIELLLVSVGVQLSGVVVGDLISVILEEVYHDRKVISLWSYHQRKRDYMKTLIPILLLISSLIFTDYIVIVASDIQE